MQNNNSKEPLYKSLNEKRTNGIWDICHQTKTGIFLSSNTFRKDKGAKYVLEIKQQYSDGLISYEDRANAEYTALAVNNLHHIAEALEEMIRQFGGVSAVTIGQKEAVLKSKYCLLNISKPIKNSRQ